MKSFEEYLQDQWKDDPDFQQLDNEEKKDFLKHYQNSYAGIGDTIRYLGKAILNDAVRWIDRCRQKIDKK